MAAKSVKVLAVIQARMTSNRLPGKVLKEIQGMPMLGWVYRRTSRAKRVSHVVVATTNDASDDPVEQYCRAQGVACIRGSVNDVLDRFFQAASQFSPETIVRITADCPFIDPDLIDDLLAAFEDTGVDFAANRLPPPWGRTYPIGLDAEVFSAKVLARAWQEARQVYHREHVTPYFYELAPVDKFSSYRRFSKLWQTPPQRGFRVLLLNHERDLGTMRWTVDTEVDYRFACEVGRYFDGRDDFSWKEILAFVETHPEVARINAQVQHKGYKDIDKRAAQTDVAENAQEK